eukprot:CAMPEP_0119428716 /NCGR_PEP_ID=MMETSP1335-20130426/40951_1 /TAXON_ID=259385 /ORGANISM="Chrysoculter rhomboideus, Strain RCC1486" /LENGTH=135 /DNA_ID=CAMNT_0007454413 /DNA_START=154 /DNA_END=562 /DNA_ORIENTATION=-
MPAAPTTLGSSADSRCAPRGGAVPLRPHQLSDAQLLTHAEALLIDDADHVEEGRLDRAEVVELCLVRDMSFAKLAKALVQLARATYRDGDPAQHANELALLGSLVLKECTHLWVLLEERAVKDPGGLDGPNHGYR